MNLANRPLVVIVGATLMIEVVMLITDMGPRLLLMSAVCVLVGIVAWVILSVGRAAVRSERVSEPHPPPPASLPDLRITLLRQGLSYGRHDNQIPERMYTSLVALIDEELAVGHGIDRSTNPSAARTVLVDDLTRFIDDPDASRSLSLEGLAQIVTLIERIRTEVSA